MSITRRLVGAAVILSALMFVPHALAQEGTATPPPATTAPAPTIPPATPLATTAATSAPTIAATPVPVNVNTLPPPTGVPTATALPADVTIDGSNILQPILRQAADEFIARNNGLRIDTQVSGTDGGFEKFCNGSLDINMATKGITDEQAAACAAKGVEFIETLLGYDAAVVVVQRDAKPTCLATEEVGRLLGPGSNGFTNWTQINSTIPDSKIGKIYAATNARAVNLLVPFIPGSQLRQDIQYVPTAAEALDKLQFEPEAIALVSSREYEEGVNQSKAVKALEIKNQTTCTSANALNFELARYPIAQPLYVYVARKSLDKKPVADFMTYLVGDGKGAVAAKGFVAANDTTFTRNQNYLTSKQVGRTYSRIQLVNVPADQQGQILLGGAPGAQAILKAVSDGFTPRYSRVQVLTPTFVGDEAAYKKLCTNALDVMGASRPLTEGEATTCKNNNVAVLTLPLAAEGAVLMVNAKATFAECLTLEQIGKLLGVEADGKVKKWSDVDATFPATDLLLVAPPDGSVSTDLLITKSIKGVAPLPRRDVTENGEPGYRAAGIGNVDGGVTWMSYSEYKKLPTTITTAKAVQVNAGNGCVAPTDATLADGTYPVARRYLLQLNQNAFQRPEVKAYVWYLLSEDGLTVLSGQASAGVDRDAFAKARDTVLEIFSKPPTPPTGATVTPGGPTPIPTVNLGLQPGATAVPGTPTPAATAAATTAATTAATAAVTIAPTIAPTTAPTTAPTAAATTAATP
jgi:phosphate transport system substrate-binding protein